MKIYFYDKKKGHKREDTDRLIRESLDDCISGYSLAPYNGEIKRTALGKPYIDYPLYIGVTHTDSVVIVAIDEKSFGIDAENIARSMQRQDSIAGRFFTENERRFVEKSADKESAFLEIWVKKEAYVKFTGEGVPAMKNCDVTLLSGFERIENDRNLIIYIYKE